MTGNTFRVGAARTAVFHCSTQGASGSSGLQVPSGTGKCVQGFARSTMFTAPRSMILPPLLCPRRWTPPSAWRSLMLSFSLAVAWRALDPLGCMSRGRCSVPTTWQHSHAGSLWPIQTESEVRLLALDLQQACYCAERRSNAKSGKAFRASHFFNLRRSPRFRNAASQSTTLGVVRRPPFKMISK